MKKMLLELFTSLSNKTGWKMVGKNEIVFKYGVLKLKMKILPVTSEFFVSLKIYNFVYWDCIPLNNCHINFEVKEEE